MDCHKLKKKKAQRFGGRYNVGKPIGLFYGLHRECD